MTQSERSKSSAILLRRERSARARNAGNGLPRSVRNRAAPTTRDANRSKLRILHVAADEFAKKGYDGARVDNIVRRCKISKNLIYHYFDSKEALFIAVLEQAYAILRERQQGMGLDSSDPIEGVSQLVIDSFKHWGESRHFIAYLNSENFYRAKHIKKSKFIQYIYPGLIESIRLLLRRGEKEGAFRSGVDPVQLYISISALGYHFFSNQCTFSVIFRKDFSGPEMIAERLKHVVDVILGYLQFKPSQADRRLASKLPEIERT